MYAFTLEIPPGVWKPNEALDDPRNRMLATIAINGCPMHLEAWEVRVGTLDGIQELVDGEAEDYDAIYNAFGAEGHFQTVEIAGRTYVLLASPFC